MGRAKLKIFRFPKKWCVGMIYGAGKVKECSVGQLKHLFFESNTHN